LGYELKIAGDLKGFKPEIKISKLDANLEIITLTLKSKIPQRPPPLDIKWSLPAHDILGQWNTGGYFSKVVQADWWPSKVTSMLARNAPVLTLFGSDNKNRLTFALSDGLNRMVLSSGVREEDGRIYNKISLFTEKHRKLTIYTVKIRLDKRDIPFYNSLAGVVQWWESFDNYQPAKVPEHAKLPMYSTWYSYHQNVSAKALLTEVEIAKKMGFESIIVDDGWQTMDSKRGYAYTGDWEPERIPNMRDFVDGVHQRGMKFLLWYSVPLVGEKSKIFKRFEGKYLRYWNGQGAYELDPRYPEVRIHIINTYKDAIKKWGVDGFKLDFIGRFVASENTVLTAENGRDFASVNEATDKLMTDILKELKKVNPEIMIEFRQPYIGPLMRKYGNMFRAGDCPNARTANRVRTTDLRLLSGFTAVHSDMIMWHYDEPVEIAALQFMDIMFSIPQVSVRLEDIPQKHFKMIKYLTKYWLKNRSVLLDGKFRAYFPQQNYPMLTGTTKDKRIIGLYSDIFITMDKLNSFKQLDILNAKNSQGIIMETQDIKGQYEVAIYDCMGNKISGRTVSLGTGLHRFDVPVAGIISFKKM
jgi:alpha-galactosidase